MTRACSPHVALVCCAGCHKPIRCRERGEDLLTQPARHVAFRAFDLVAHRRPLGRLRRHSSIVIALSGHVATALRTTSSLPAGTSGVAT